MMRQISGGRRTQLALALCGAALAMLPAISQAQAKETQSKQGESAKTEEPDKPITDRDVGAKDVALTPLSDLNLRKGEIPPLLISAQEDPYTLSGLARCSQLASAIGELDAMLGDDIDVAQAKGRAISAGRVAQSVAGSFIPFRGVIRELSGANAQERKIQAAIFAGTARRSFLKGIGQQRGCRYPARSATAQVIAAAEAAAQAEAEAKAEAKSRK
jgi:hypothetical protein